MKLPENLRDNFKEPLGKLIPDKDTSKENLEKEIAQSPLVITVGDRTTEKMISYGLIPSIQVVDGQEKREKRDVPESENISTELTCDNPAAEITEQAIQTIKTAFESKYPVRIIVNGEEDLLVLPICIHAPDDSIVMYGQPNEGLVVVKIDSETRNKTKSLLNLLT